MALTRTTFLEAVNITLRMMGEAPVDSVDGQFGYAQQAADMVNDASRKLQNEPWTFNTDYQRKLQPDGVTKQIKVGNNVLRVELNPYDYPDFEVVLRGDKLYDRRKNTYEFTQDIVADITYVLDWDELPEYARQYIAVKAGRELQEMLIGSSDLTQMNFSKEAEARTAFIEMETTISPHSMLSGNPNLASKYLGYVPSQALRRY